MIKAKECHNCKHRNVDGSTQPCVDCYCAGKWEPVTAPSQEGRKDDSDKLRYDLYPPEALEGAVRILTFGAKKYGDRSWEKGMSWGRVFGALMRHLWAWWRGEVQGPETGESHLHHAACCIAFLQTYEQRGVGKDDRPSSVKES